MARLEALKLASLLQERLLDFSSSSAFLREPELQEACRQFWTGPCTQAGLLSELWVEGSIPPAHSDLSLGALSEAGEYPAELARHLAKRDVMPWERPLYSHQLEALRAAQEPAEGQRPAVVVTAGTGAGKTESFLLPMLRDLWDTPRNSHAGCRALILYPMNALVNDQVDRLYNWLRGQQKLTLCHFTGETPEDASRANKQEVEVWEPCRARTRQQARGLESPTGKAVKASERLSVPDILITNYSMLEYMLARPQDRVFFGSDLQVVVLDEAHLYTGTLAAEITLLLRRLYDKCRRTSSQILQFATSATIGAGLEEFAATLFSKPASLVRVVSGRDAPSQLGERRPPRRPATPETVPTFQTPVLKTDPDGHGEELVRSAEECLALSPLLETLTDSDIVAKARDDSQGIVASFLLQALLHSPAMHDLEAAIRHQRYQTLDQLAQTLWSRHDQAALEATINLLSLAAAAREQLDSMPLLPHRLHLMVRFPEGLGVCLNTQCPDSTAPRWGGLGPLLSGEPESCPHCLSLALALVRCGNCGQSALGAIRRGNTWLPYRRKEETPHFLGPAGQTTERLHLDPRSCKQTGEGQGVALSVLERCPHCHGDLKQMTRMENRSPLLLSLVAETLLSALPPLPGSYPGANRKLPARGRRLLAFSDSRNEAARLGPRLRRQHELQVVRAALAQQLMAEAGPDPEEMEYYRTTRDALREELESSSLSPVLRKIKQDDLERLERLIVARSEGDEVGVWAGRLSKHELMAELLDPEVGKQHRMKNWSPARWEENFLKSSESANLRLGLEVITPLRRHSATLESLGLLEVTYPGLSQLQLPDRLKSDLPSACRKPLGKVWPDFLAAICDTLRTDMAITLGDWALDRQYAEQGRYFGQWCSEPEFIGQQERKNRRQFVASVLMQAGCSSEEQAWELTTPVLEQVFQQLFNHGRQALSAYHRADPAASQFSWLESLPDYHHQRQPSRAVRLVYPGLGLRRPSRLFVCSCTGQVWPRSVLSCAPDPGSQGTLEATDDAALDRSPRVGRSRREYRESPVFMMGLWAEEHSAQLSHQEGRRLQELFRGGVRNLLSSTTTMELGIDIGGLSATMLSNVPPGKANYLQRAGRVGRRADGSSVVVTCARSQPYDRAVFRNIGSFLGRVLLRPRVFLQRPRVVRRHFHAWLMGRFFEQLYRPDQHVGAMNAFGRMGGFCGRSLPQRWDSAATKLPPLPEPEPPLPEDFPRPAWWKDAGPGLVEAYRAWVAHVRADQPVRSHLAKLFCDTVLDFERDGEALFDLEADQFRRAVGDWCKDYDALLETWRTAEKPAQANSLRYRLMSLFRTTVIEALSDARYLPRYGFPIGLHRLKVMVDDNGFLREEDRFRLERSGLLALREYVPGSQLVVGGQLVTSRGILKHWTGENIDSAFGVQGYFTRCPNEHFYYWRAKAPERCPICEESGGPTPTSLLFPAHGYTTAAWDPPRYSTDTEKVGSVRLETIAFTTGTDERREENFAGVPGLLLRYREEGELLVINGGDDDRGFAVCTSCGYADSEKFLGSGRMQLPRNFERHKPLREVEGSPCWGEHEAPVLRNQHLGARQPTDVLLVDWSAALPVASRKIEIITTLGTALHLAGARLLELDSRELGSMVVPTSLDSFASVLYDNVPGGAGHVLELLEHGAEWLRLARQIMWVDEQHHERCRTACLDCLLSFDVQNLIQGDQFDRRKALEALDPICP